MEALNVAAEYRKAFPQETSPQGRALIQKWADSKVQFDGWVLDDGDYYTREEWDSQYAEPKANLSAQDNFRNWLDEES